MEDCYYFLYTNCKKSDCEFRHSLAAKNNPVLCSNWKSNGVCDVNCTYRHSMYHLSKKRVEKECHRERQGEIKVGFDYRHTNEDDVKAVNNKKECYWEKQGGCTKEDCDYKHTNEDDLKAVIEKDYDYTHTKDDDVKAVINKKECYWEKQGACTKEDCEYRHTKKETNHKAVNKRGNIACYFERQGGGCIKEDCKYMHTHREDKKKDSIECYWEKNGGCTRKNCVYKHTNKDRETKAKNKLDCYWENNGGCTKDNCEYKHANKQQTEPIKQYEMCKDLFVKKQSKILDKKFGSDSFKDANDNKYIKKYNRHDQTESKTTKLKRWGDKDAYNKIDGQDSQDNLKHERNESVDIYEGLDNEKAKSEESFTNNYTDFGVSEEHSSGTEIVGKDKLVEKSVNAATKIVLPLLIDEKPLFDESFHVLNQIKQSGKRKITYEDVKYKKCKLQDKLDFLKSNIGDLLKKKRKTSLAKIDNLFDSK